MARDFIFNALSLDLTEINTLEEAKKCFESFVLALSAAVDENICSRVLRSQILLQDAELKTRTNEIWAIGDWLCDTAVDRDARNFILTLDSKIPVERDFDVDSETEEELLSIDFRIGDENGPASFEAGFALYYNSILCSIPSNSLWKNESLSLYLASNGTIKSTAILDHISDDSHCIFFRPEQPESNKPSISTVSDFITKKAEHFPQLDFSPAVDDQITALTTRQIITLVKKLEVMNLTCVEWIKSQKNLPDYRFFWRNESISTMQRPKFVDARTFPLPSGEKAVFESHADFSASHRIHFIEDSETRKFVIGYVGNHLPTTKYH